MSWGTHTMSRPARTTGRVLLAAVVLGSLLFTLGDEKVTKSFRELRKKAAYNEVGCGVCKALSHEIRKGIIKVSKSTLNLDMRGRIDSKGQRRGKVIDYRMSETRVLEVLEGDDGPVCQRMDDWSVVRVPFGTEGFKSLAVQKYKNTEHGPHGEMVIEGVDIPTAFVRGQCEEMFEEHEEAIYELVRTTKVEDVAEAICRKIMGLCPAGVDLGTNADGKSLGDEMADMGNEKDAKTKQNEL